MSYINIYDTFSEMHESNGPPLWSSSQCSWPQTQRPWVRFTALSDFLSSGSRTGSTQPREDN
jgi:hypothetical protein